MVAVAGCEKTLIPSSNDEEESALSGCLVSAHRLPDYFFCYFLVILGSSHGRIGERENLHALPHLVRPPSLPGCWR